MEKSVGWDTALHAGKDLAVSLGMLPYRLFLEGIHLLSRLASLLAPLTTSEDAVRRGLPATMLQHHVVAGRVRTFLPTQAVQGDHRTN